MRRSVAQFVHREFRESGTGSLNSAGASMELRLNYGGEAREYDQVEVRIGDAPSGLDLNVFGNLKKGNHQTHPSRG